MKLRIATYNIFHCEDIRTEKIDFDEYAKKILTFNADIIGLNEVTDEGEEDEYQPDARMLGERMGYTHFFAKATDIDGGNNPFGNAMLTRLKVKKCEVIPIPDPDPKAYDGYYETRCVLKVETAEPDMTFLITHFGLNPDEQKNAVDTVLKELKSERCVVMGDLNLTPDSDILKPLTDILTEAGEFAKGNKLTFNSVSPSKKIDYILVTPDIKILGADIPEGIISDHLPLIADIEI